MESVIKCKMLSYGLVEVRDAGATSPRYRLYVAGQLKSYSDDLYTILAEFDRLYSLSAQHNTRGRTWTTQRAD